MPPRGRCWGCPRFEQKFDSRGPTSSDVRSGSRGGLIPLLGACTRSVPPPKLNPASGVQGCSPPVAGVRLVPLLLPTLSPPPGHAPPVDPHSTQRPARPCGVCALRVSRVCVSLLLVSPGPRVCFIGIDRSQYHRTPAKEPPVRWDRLLPLSKILSWFSMERERDLNRSEYLRSLKDKKKAVQICTTFF